MEAELEEVRSDLAELPKGWAWRTMEEVSEVVGGATPKTSEQENYEGGTIAWLTPADLSGYSDKYIERGARFITKKGLESCSTKLLPKGTVLFTSRAPIGYVAIASGEVCTNQGFKSFVLDEAQVTPDYVYWWLKGAKAMAEEVASGTTFLELSTAKAKKLPIPVAPLPQQRRIVEAIELQLGRLDAAVARLQGAKARLKRYKQAVLKAAYDQFEKRPLEELASVITKGASPSWQGVKYVNDTTQTLFVTSENVREGYLDLSEPKYVENSFNQLQKRSMLKNGDVLLNIVGASIGRAAIYDRDDLANTNQAVCLIRTTEELDNSFLCNYLNSEEAKTYYSRNQVDVARANLSLGDVRELPVPYFPVKEQRTFSKKIDQNLAAANTMESTLDAQLLQAGRLRQAVLKRAFVGRLV